MTAWKSVFVRVRKYRCPARKAFLESFVGLVLLFVEAGLALHVDRGVLVTASRWLCDYLHGYSPKQTHKKKKLRITP